MRKIIVSNLISVDGFIAGADGNIDWHTVDGEFNDFAEKLLDSVDTILFGRVTYDLMAGYWPTPAALDDDPVIAKGMNALEKIVFSRTLSQAEWENTAVFPSIAEDEIRELKEKPGKNIVIFGSGTIVSQLTKLRLIDEYWLTVNPVILGNGIGQFADFNEPFKLTLLGSQPFASGNILIKYAPA